MPDYGFNLNLGPQTKPTSLADMLNTAGAAQQLQQAMQINPLQLQEAQQKLQQSQQMNPLLLKQQEQVVGKSGIELEQSQRVNEEQKALQQFFSKPENFQTNGRIDINKLNSAIPKIAPISGAKHITELTSLAEQQTKSIEARAKLTTSQRTIIAGPIGIIGRMGINDPKVYIQELNNLKEFHKNEPDMLDAFDAQINLFKHLKEGPNVSKAAVLNAQSLMTPEQQQAALSEKAKLVDTGGGLQETIETPGVGGIKPSITPTGKTMKKTLAPQVYTTETGAPGIIGGNGGTTKPAVQPAEQPTETITNPPKGMSQKGAAKGIQDNFAAKGGLQRAPDETYEAYKARTARLSALPTNANNALNLSNPDSVPNMEYTNDKILKLLAKKDLDIGPIANAVANKTGGIGLTADQQEVQKYLEQRIRQEAARSNQDQASQRSAYGSFGTAKAALYDIIYNDKGMLASQKLYNKGILKAQGNPNKPNLSAVNEFENKFNELNSDPNLAHLLGVIGNKTMDKLSDSDKSHLKKYFSNMSQKEIQDLFDKKEKLEALVNGVK